MDELKYRALIFNELLKYRYVMKMGKKGVLSDIVLTFDKSDFHHIIGLQKLQDIHIAKQNKKQLFDDILCGKTTYKDINKSKYFKDNETRFNNAIYLEELIDNNDIIFRCNNNQNYSRINAEYILESSKDKNAFYIFINSRDKNSNEFVCCSFFPKGDKDYTRNNSRMHLLHKEKINLISSEIIIQKTNKSLMTV